MKNFKYLLRKKAIYLFGSIALIVVALAITYSCSKENVVKKNEPQTVPEAMSSEKQFIVFDKSGNNSVTLRLSSDDATLLAGYNDESYELIINPEVPDETPYDELTIAIEDPEYTDLKSSIEVKRVTVQMDIINVSFKDKVNNYALVSNVSSMVDEDEPEMEQEGELKAGLCRWFPRDYEYYDVDAWGATKVYMEFKRTKKTCNNIKYYVCKYNTTDSYAYHHLKHPGDKATTNVQSGQVGITLLYKHYKNQTPTYTFYY
ncbi:MAG: hypothetical protein JEZ09_08410 [Salinivirgaceae bacterium]|nr:hypothetical protein [Salinivirgaceae bacterium]